jgi:hypothetical protein
MAAMIGNDLYPCVLGSRILGGYALKGGLARRPPVAALALLGSSHSRGQAV